MIVNSSIFLPLVSFGLSPTYPPYGTPIPAPIPAPIRLFVHPLDERFWRTVKYEEVYLKSYRDMVEACRELGRYLGWYNMERKHSSLGDRTPDAIYSSRETGDHEAA